MMDLRKVHLYLGCLFSPLLIYFSLSGGWQVYRFNDVPKDNPNSYKRFFRELSKPHRDSTPPGQNPKEVTSKLFSALALAMVIGIVVTAILGIVLALRMNRRRKAAVGCLLVGTLLPLLFLFLA